MNIEDFFSQLSKSKDALLILDYDGTLAPFVQNPQEAYPYPGVMERIQMIMQDPSAKVVILSGRALGDLTPLISLCPLPELVGSHGGEDLNGMINLSNDVMDVLSLAAEEAKLWAPDLFCEIKPLSVALHWRGKDPRMASIVLELWREKTVIYPLELHPFDGGIELRSPIMNKGNAVRMLTEGVEFSTPIAYLGDDLTDEEAFEILGDRALKVLVRKEMRKTKADVKLTPPDELIDFFDRWLKTKSKEHA